MTVMSNLAIIFIVSKFIIRFLVLMWQNCCLWCAFFSFFFFGFSISFLWQSVISVLCCLRSLQNLFVVFISVEMIFAHCFCQVNNAWIMISHTLYVTLFLMWMIFLDFYHINVFSRLKILSNGVFIDFWAWFYLSILLCTIGIFTWQ